MPQDSPGIPGIIDGRVSAVLGPDGAVSLYARCGASQIELVVAPDHVAALVAALLGDGKGTQVPCCIGLCV